MLRSLIVGSVALLHAFCAIAVSGQQVPQSVSLAEAIELLNRQSPELASARSRLRGLLGAARQGRAIENPTASFTNEDLGEYSERYFNVSQPMDFLWQGGARGRRADARSEEARGLFMADSAGIVLELKRVFVRAWEHRELVSALAEADATHADVLEDATQRFAQDDIAGYDLRRLRVARAGAARRLARAQEALADAERRLGATVTGDESLPRVRAEDPNTEALLAGLDFDAPSQALQVRPDLVAAASRTRSLDAEAALVGRSVMSGTTLTAGFKQQSDGRDGVFLGLQLPLPFLDRRGGAGEAAEADAERSRSEAEALRRSVVREAALAEARLESALRLRASFGASGAQDARALLEAARVAYAEGEIGVAALVDAADAFVEARSLEASVRADVWAAVFELEYAVGGFPDQTDTGVER